MKVILIQGLLAPYRYPLFEELAKTADWEFEVWFMGREVKNRIWNKEAITEYRFNHRFLDGITLNFGLKDTYPFWLNFSIYSDLVKAKPDVVIMMGWDSLSSFLIHLYCHFSGAKFILYSDSTPLEKSWRRTVTKPLISLHVKTADALIAGGSRSRTYLENLGAAKNSIFVSFNTVDVEKYQKRTHSFRKFSRQTRKELGIGNKKIILYYGQLIERKGVDLLLAAFNELKKANHNVALLLIGDGPFREKLTEIIIKQGIDDALLLPNPGDEAVCQYYAITNVFVLPSREEVWGLVVNEAMAAGLPVVVSDQVGCSADLIIENFSGYTFESENIVDLSKKIETVISNNPLRQLISLRAFERIKLFSPRLTIKKFREAVESTFTLPDTQLHFLQPAKSNFISVIIPVYQDTEGLRRTLLSLKQQQDAPDFEVIIENDYEGVGSYQTRNKALERSQGKHLAFIDAGTTASPNWLRTGSQNLQHSDYVGGPIARTSDQLFSISKSAKLFGKYREFAVEEFFDDAHFFPTTNLFTKRNVIEKVGGFDSRLRSSGDLEFGDRIYRSGFCIQHYDPHLIVSHPFRTYRQLVEKQKRLASGSSDLKRYYPKRFGNSRFEFVPKIIRALLPPLWLLKKKSYQTLSWTEKYILFFTTYHLSFIHYLSTKQYDQLRER